MMKARVQAATIAAVIVAGLVASEVAGQGSRSPAEASFREDAWTNAPADRIRGDGALSYRDDGSADPDCVVAWVDKGGMFFLRTVRANCTPVTSRSITLDFGDPVSPPAVCSVQDQYGNTLDVCGANAVPDVRIIAHSAFKDAALTGGTTLTMPFSLRADFSSTAFELQFEQPVGVTGTSTMRTLEGPSGAVAELYQYVKQGRKTTKVSLGRYRMPFGLTIVKQ